MVDEKRPLTRQERRQRQKRLERTLRRRRENGAPGAVADKGSPTSGTGPDAEASSAAGSGRSPTREITAADVTGLKYFEQLAPLLERLHEVGCERDKADNRDLHYDQLCLLLLLGLFNPVVDSLRGLQQASELELVQERLQLGRASLGSLSEASRVFDAERLKAIIEELGGQLQPLARDPRLKDIRKTLTLVDGTLARALGGGSEIALACDFIYAAESARFGLPEITLGLIPGFGGTQRLPRLIGPHLAKELIFTGRMITAAEALQVGMVNKVVPAAALMEEVFKTARDLAAKGKVSLRAAKQAVNNGLNADLATGCHIEVEAFALCMASPDAKEGTRAFLEKRKPLFKGGLKE